MKKITINDQITGGSFDFFDNASNTILRSFTGFEYANVKSVIDNVAGQPGAVFSTSSFGERRMSFQGDLVAGIPAVFTQRRQLLQVMQQRARMKLFEITTYDDVALQFEAEIVKFTAPYTHQIHTFLFELIAPDWRFYSQTESTDTFLPNATANINNGGTELTDPVFTITGPGTDITITNNDTTETFTISNLTAGETTEVDVLNREVKHNGVVDYSVFTGDFICLDTGNNNFTFTVVSGSDANTKLDVTYRDAYNGI